MGNTYKNVVKMEKLENTNTFTCGRLVSRDLVPGTKNQTVILEKVQLTPVRGHKRETHQNCGSFEKMHRGRGFCLERGKRSRSKLKVWGGKKVQNIKRFNV